MRFITDRQAARYPTLANTPEDQRERLFEDAELAYEYVEENSWATEDDLRRYLETRELDPDRATAALNFLQESGRLFAAPETAVTPEPAQRTRRLHDMSADELRDLARIAGVSGRSNLKKDELVAALREQGFTP